MLMKHMMLLIFLIFPFFSFSQLLINEFSSKGTFTNSNNNECDWIEIIATSPMVNLSDFFLSDNISNLNKTNLPNFFLDSGKVFLISLGDLTVDSLSVIDSLEFYNAQFKIKKSETIFISDVDGNIIDSKLVEVNFHTLSEGRNIYDQTSWVVYEKPTPGYRNDTTSCIAQLPPPILSKSSGMFDSSFYLHVLHDSSIIIRYTINGDIPNQNSNIYIDSILIDSTSIISLRSFKSGYCASKTIDRTFLINEELGGLKIISLVVDSNALWGDSLGIYVIGLNGDSTHPYTNANFWNDNYIYSRIEFFSETSEPIVSEEADLRINGGITRTYPQKSFKLNFRSKYSGNLDWNFLPNKPNINSFNNIILRNGGSHWGKTHRINDGLISMLSQETNVDVMGYEPCVLFLNGTFWGQYGMRENIDEHYIEDNHSINSEDVNIISATKGVLNGSYEYFINVFDTITTSDPSSNFYSNLVDDKINIDNYFDYFIIETYIQNGDWHAGRNNVKFWQSASSKWNYVLYDTDQSYSNKFDSINSISFARNPYLLNSNGDTTDRSSIHSKIFNHILFNSDLKCRLITRYTELIENYFNPSVFEYQIELLKSKIEQIVPRHYLKWPINNFSYADWIISLSNYKQKNKERYNSYLFDLKEEFNLDDVHEISFNVKPEKSGYLSFSTYDEFEFPHKKVFFKTDCENIIKAKAFSNEYVFSHWSSANEVIDLNDTLDINNQILDEIDANFRECLISDISIEINGKGTASVNFEYSYPPYNYQWYLNGTPLNENDSIITLKHSGFYKVLVIDKDNCNTLSNEFYFDCNQLISVKLSKDSLSEKLLLDYDGGVEPYEIIWYQNDIVIDIDTDSILALNSLEIFENNVYFQVMIIDSNGCSNLSEKIIVTDNIISLYPNPIQSDDDLNVIFLQEKFVDYNYNIYDLYNTKIVTENITHSSENKFRKFKLSLKNLKRTGIYFIEITSIKGKKIGRFMFIKN